jgi:uncharacterized protein YndB with AHSA1/START domain
MPELPSEADIAAPADRIFDIITDLANQGRWLSKSSAFKGTLDVSSARAQLGTTYREPGPIGVRNGVVTDFEPPTRITFDQPMTLKWHLGTLGVVLRYELTPLGGTDAGTHVRRVCTLTVPRHLMLVKPVVVRSFRVESARTLAALKAYTDHLAHHDETGIDHP